eukprot:2727508-Amphidinium_carterae.1
MPELFKPLDMPNHAPAIRAIEDRRLRCPEHSINFELMQQSLQTIRNDLSECIVRDAASCGAVTAPHCHALRNSSLHVTLPHSVGNLMGDPWQDRRTGGQAINATAVSRQAGPVMSFATPPPDHSQDIAVGIKHGSRNIETQESPRRRHVTF